MFYKSIVFLAAGLVMTATMAVGSAGWTEGLAIITLVGFGAVLISLMLARSLLPDYIAHVFSLIIGTAWSFWVTAQLLPANFTWLERWQNLVERHQRWVLQMVDGGVSYDNLMFIFQMSLILWAMGYLTIWLLFRSEQMWQSLTPGGMVLLINLYYAPKDITAWFFIYLMLSLLLIIRFNLLQQEARWRAEGTFFRSDIGFDFLRDGLIFSVLVMSFAWLTPPFVDAKSLNLLGEAQDSWQQVQQEWNRLYANLNYRPQNPAASFGQSLTLGGPRNLTADSVMDVQAVGNGHYWRATVYDEYNGSIWRTNDTDSATFDPVSPLAFPLYIARQPVTQTYTLYRNGLTVLYALNYPIGLNRSAKVTLGVAAEITTIRNPTSLYTGENYQVVSLVSQATAAQLQQSGLDYPASIVPRYQQLPDTVTERTRELARRLTMPFNNNYDKARAIESYLRNELSYNDQIAVPPSNVDKVDYILFNSKEAYCDYYATAMIVMARSVGIPSRLAAGFAQGTYDAEKGLFHVVDTNAHSWVEVYFPTYGWIDFEPTSAQSPLSRPTAPPNQGTNPTPPPPSSQDNVGKRGNIPVDEESMGGTALKIRIPWLGQITISATIIRGGFVFVGLIMLAGMAIFIFWWQRQQSTGSIFQLYRQMLRLADGLGVTMQPWQTPNEYATILQQHLPTGQGEIETITAEYVRQSFGATAKGKNAALFVSSYESYHAWHRLRSEMLRAIAKHFLPKWLLN